MITVPRITRALHAFAVALHVLALKSEIVQVRRRRERTVAQSHIVSAAIDKRITELVDEGQRQLQLRVDAVASQQETANLLWAELDKYES